MTTPIYFIRTPLRQVGGLTYGGPMRIKVGRRRVAYAGFASVALAQVVCRYWNIPAEHYIEPWEEAMRHEDPDAFADQVLLFHDESDFRAWLETPETFPVEHHTVALHPSRLPEARRRSA